MLTADKLKAMEPGEIFATGTAIDDPNGLFMMGTGRKLKWVACRGRGYWDWAIYCYYADEGWTDEMIHDSGEKVTLENNIKGCVNCDKEAFELYRY